MFTIEFGYNFELFTAVRISSLRGITSSCVFSFILDCNTNRYFHPSEEVSEVIPFFRRGSWSRAVGCRTDNHIGVPVKLGVLLL